MPETSFKETRIRNITNLYYSKPEVQKAIFEFCKNREISPRYFEGFGKRPDAFEYPGDVFELAKKGATSFHCSEELWKNPLDIKTGMTEEQANELRAGWDLLLDIDCKWFDYAKLAAKAILKVLEDNNLKNVGLKFSGSKGFHILIPWKAFPEEIGETLLKDSFPEIPRKIVAYIRFEAEKNLQKILPENFYEQFKDVDIKKGFKCNNCNEIADSYELANFFCPACNQGEQRKINPEESKKYLCPNCKREFVKESSTQVSECSKCNLISTKNPNNFSSSISTDLFDLMGLDIVLVSPRHLFRAPYSLHEKTALASVVLEKKELENFELKHASPLKVEVKNFFPNSRENEASELVLQALDWYKENSPGEDKKKKFSPDFQPIKLVKLSEDNFPPCVKNILKGIRDGRKRALFVLINLFRSVGMENDELEKRIEDWNKKNANPLKQGYIRSQLNWAYRKKPILPPNCQEFYKNLGVCVPDDFCRLVKNPTNYTIRKNLQANRNSKKKVSKKRIVEMKA